MAAELSEDQAARLTPLTGTDADTLTQPRAGYAWRWKAASCLNWRTAAARPPR
jgi:hypothetical protein